MRFEGKSAIVTGASEGIGFAVAKALVADGANVVLTARRESGLVDAVRRLGPQASYVAGDMSEEDTSERAVAQAVARGGGLDLLVCNAGIMVPGLLAHQPMADVDRVIAVNLRGTIACVRAACTALAKRDGAAITVMSSSVGRLPTAGMGVYGATKAALHYLVPTWASELAPLGIRVNALCVGITDTPGLRAGAEAVPGLTEMVIATSLVKRTATADEVARPVLNLLDEHDSGFVTGSVWDFDGGHGRASHAA